MVVMFLLGWKLKPTRSPKAPIRRSPPGAADGVGGVFDDPQTAALGQSVERVHVDRQAREMHRHDRPGARGEGRFDLLQVEVAGGELDIDEDRPGAGAHDHVGGGGEGHRRHDHLVPGPDVAQGQGHFQRRGTGAEGPHRPPAAQVIGQGRLESAHLRAGGEPAGLEHFHHPLDRLLIEGGPGKGEKLGHCSSFFKMPMP